MLATANANLQECLGERCGALANQSCTCDEQKQAVARIREIIAACEATPATPPPSSTVNSNSNSNSNLAAINNAVQGIGGLALDLLQQQQAAEAQREAEAEQQRILEEQRELQEEANRQAEIERVRQMLGDAFKNAAELSVPSTCAACSDPSLDDTLGRCTRECQAPAPPDADGDRAKPRPRDLGPATESNDCDDPAFVRVDLVQDNDQPFDMSDQAYGSMFSCPPDGTEMLMCVPRTWWAQVKRSAHRRECIYFELVTPTRSRTPDVREP